MIVPWQEIPADTLTNLIEEFVTRDGTDYGEQEVPLSSRVDQVRRQLQKKEALVWFDELADSVTILTREEAAARSD